MLPFWARVDLGAMAMKEGSAFPKAPASLEHQRLNSNHGLVLFNPLIEALSGATTLGQRGPGSNGNERVLCIPQSSSITGHLLGEGSYPSAEKQSVYSTAPANWASVCLCIYICVCVCVCKFWTKFVYCALKTRKKGVISGHELMQVLLAE